MIEKYGFVYIWRDRKHKRYYIGCHWGTVDDGYICSSTWMKNSFNRRQDDFKRRILKTKILTKKEMFETEQYYFSMIKPEELKVRYYNLRIDVGHWLTNDIETVSIKEKISNSLKRFYKEHGSHNKGRIFSDKHKQKLSVSHKGKIHKPHSEETKIKIGEANKGNKHSEETKIKIGEANKGNKHSEETKEKLSFSSIGEKNGFFGKTHSDESKQKIREARKGKPSPNKDKPWSDARRKAHNMKNKDKL